MRYEKTVGTGARESSMIEAFVTNLGKYNNDVLCGEYLKLPATTEDVQGLLSRIGVDGVVYEEFFITDYKTDISGLSDCLGEYESIDELNYLAALLDEMDEDELTKFKAAVECGDDTGSVKDLINLAQNLDCYDYFPGVDSNEDLGYYLIDNYGMLAIPADVQPYFDYEAYGRDYALNESGDFTGGGYIVRGYGRSTEYYDGRRDDIPEEYRIFAYPDPQKMNMREQMEMYGNMVMAGRSADRHVRAHEEI